MFGFRHHTKAANSGATKAANRQCTHPKALPRWDNVDEMGNPERISRYYCPDCDQFIEPAARANTEKRR